MMMKDEEKNLPRCLDSVSNICDEIIIVDTGSTDKSVEIARGYGAKVYPGVFNWRKPPIFDFSLHRNSAFEYTEEHFANNNDWLVVVDCDETIEVNDPATLKDRLSRIAPIISGIVVVVHNIENDEINMSWYGSRLFRANKGTYYENYIHNEVKLEHGYMAGTDIIFHHYGYEKGAIMNSKRDRALTSLERRINEDPNDYNAWFYVCVTNSGYGNYETAIEAGHKCLEILSTVDKVMDDPNTKMNYYGLLYYTIGACWLNLHNGPKAYAAYRKGFDFWPNDMDLNFALAELGYFSKEKEILMFHGERYLEALKKYRKELSMSDDIDKFATWIQYDNLTLSKRHVACGTKKHEKNLTEWMEEHTP